MNCQLCNNPIEGPEFGPEPGDVWCLSCWFAWQENVEKIGSLARGFERELCSLPGPRKDSLTLTELRERAGGVESSLDGRYGDIEDEIRELEDEKKKLEDRYRDLDALREALSELPAGFPEDRPVFRRQVKAPASPP